MELKDFIAQTMMQIIDGVNSAIEYAQENKAIVNPKEYLRFGDARNFVIDGELDYSQIIEFDVAVTTSEGSEVKSGLGIIIAAIGSGLQAKSDQASSTANRIRFSIPVTLPKG